MPEKLKLRVSTDSGRGLTERQRADRRSVVLRPPTLTTILQLIDSFEGLDAEVKEEVKNVARRYPNQAYPHFINNLQNIVGRVQIARRDSLRTYSVIKDDLNDCGEHVVDR